eukprot:TRINITY_DN3540_c0_g1_i6.p1 TRINITY_DN3540_c0_g1~~TRINITY_DN3540_c0_g1_i6.p1  ORF type:complete len:341 (-),score=98.76 TRINITY_DN3540_c0_g1_i6:52-1074(-)
MVASVALGGRWRLLEEENLALRAELETRNRAIGLAESTAEHAQQGWRLAEAQAERRRAEAEAAVAEVAALRLQLSSETCKLEEAAAAHGAMSQRADELNAAREALTSEGAQLRATLGNCESAAARFRSAAAGSELKLAREEGLRCEAEASGERLRAELNVAEGRLKNRGTHVDKLGMHEVKTSGATLQPISNGRRVRKQIVLTYPSHSEGGVETSALLVLVELAPLSGSDEGPAPVDPEALTHWSGRHALILPDEEVRLVNAYAEQQGLVVHPLQELEEKLGKISLAIIKDPDGFEIAVATDSITQAMLAATTFPDPASFLSSYEERKTKYEMSWLKSEL